MTASKLGKLANEFFDLEKIIFETLVSQGFIAEANSMESVRNSVANALSIDKTVQMTDDSLYRSVLFMRYWLTTLTVGKLLQKS